MASGETYAEVDDGGGHEGAVAAEVGVGEVGADDGRHPDGADPVGDVVGRRHHALVQLRRQVQHQVRRDAVERHPLEHLVHCIPKKKEIRQGMFRLCFKCTEIESLLTC